jgi:predicted metal-dependent hydrolase
MRSGSLVNLDSDSGAIPVVFRRHARAKHYKLRVESDGLALVTVPRGGSQAEARGFFEKHRSWVESERQKRRSEPHGQVWRPGFKILFRGEKSVLLFERVYARPFVVFEDQRVAIADPEMDLKRPVCEHLNRLARLELPVRVNQLADQLDAPHARTTVRNQSTRWGSCSQSGTISLNWRLMQAPPEVSDYVIIHELMHRIEMNHSNRFWTLVSDGCPDYLKHENWLKEHARIVGL